MRSFVMGVMIAAAAGASVANASVTVSAAPYDLNMPAGAGTTIDFDHALPTGFTLTGSGYLIQSGDNSLGAAPAAGPTDATDDHSAYLSVYDGWAKLMGDTSFHSVSFFWGSMDSYNAFDLLDASGNVFGTILSGAIPAGTNGDQLGAWTNQRVTVTSGQAIYGVQLRSTTPAFEADNFFFYGHLGGNDVPAGAVPEPASWAMMLAGFGAVGGAIRSQRRKISFAAA